MNKFVLKSLLTLTISFCLSVVYTPIFANTSTTSYYKKTKACEIFDLTATPQPCTPNGVFFVVIDFEVAGDPSGGFTVQGNGNDYGTFEYGDLPIEVGPLDGDGVTEYEFVVTDLEDDECTAFTVIDPVTCDVQGACEITELVVDPLDCNDDGTYDIVINFEYSNPGNDFFDLYDENGNLLAFYELAALPVTHPDFVPSGNDFDVITVCINDNPNCCATEEFLAPDCTPPPCEISNVTATPGDCDGLLFWVTINFEYNNTGDFFTVAGNGNDYGTFAYTNLPVVVGPLVGDGTTIWEFVVTDQEDPNCSDFTVIDPVDCGMNACEIWDLVVEPLECNDDGTYDIVIDFNYANPGNDFFDVYDANGNNIGYYELAALPVTHLNFVPSGNPVDVLSVCINDNPNCCAETEFEALDCDPPACEIWDLVAEAHDCDDNGQFLVDIDFNFANTSDSFTVVGNGNNYGTFAYADLFITLGPFDGNGQSLEFIVFDQLDDGCSAEVGLEAPNCAQGACEIWDLVVEPLECNDDGTYDIVIDFNYANPGNDFFDVYDANGNNIGYYELAALPVTHLNFVPSGNPVDVLSVCINDNPNCCAETEFEALDCDPPACEIWDLVAEVHDCDDNGQFLVDIDFNFANTSDSFTVVGNGNNYGTFAYADLFITLGPFDGNGQSLEFIVFDQLDDGCSAEVGLEAPNCAQGACEIWDLVVEPLECNDDGTYDIVIDFNYANPGNDFFDVYDANGNNIGYYELAALPVTHLNFVPSGNPVDVLSVCINDNPNCCADTEFEALDCDPPTCEIWDLVAEAHDCDDNGQFLVDIDFNFANTSDSFTIVGNGNNYGTFAYADLFITLGPFEGNGQSLEFIVFDQLDDGCNAEVFIDAPNCDQGACEIWDLVVEPLECNDDGTYDIVIDFNYANPGNDFFDVYDANGNNIGYYELAALPVTHLNFVPSGNPVDVLSVCINDNPYCCAETEFEALDCDPPACEIWDLVAEAHDCDDNGQFLVDIDFNFANTSDSFTVVGNGNNYGTFAYADLFITLGPFEGNGQSLEFIVFDQLDDGCSAEVGLEAPNCAQDACEIWDLVVEPLECNDDGTYDIVIDFNYANPGNDFFDVYDANGNNIGYYELAALPVTHLNFVPSGNPVDVLSVCINDNPNCCADTEFEALDCDATACEIWDLVAEAHDCDDNGQFLVDLDFNFANTSDSFTVVGNGNNYGTFAYADLFITLGPLDGNGQTLEFIVFDQLDDGCSAEVGLEAPDCGVTATCEIGELVLDLGCDGPVFGTLDFEYANTSDFFDLDINGEHIGTFAYADLPIDLGPLDGTGSVELVFSVFDAEFGDNCGATASVGPIDCEDNCTISELEYEFIECNGDDSWFALIDFNIENPHNDSFEVKDIFGHLLGTYALDDLPVTVEIPIHPNNVQFISVCNYGEFTECCEQIQVEQPDCGGGDCVISGLEASSPECNPNGGYDLLINFSVENPSNDSYDLYDGNGELIGYYSLNELPLHLNNYHPSQANLEVFTVCINDNPNCCSTLTVEFPDCGGDCEIGELQISNSPCNPNGIYEVSLDFDYDNTSDSFEVVINGQFYGTFAYADLPVDLGNYDIAQIQTLVVEVYDLEHPNCAREAIYVVDCEGTNECLIEDLIVEAYDCDDNGQFLIDLTFSFDNTSDSFIVVGNGNNYGTFAYDDLYITLGPFEGNGQILEFVVFDQNQESCHEVTTLEAPNCGGGDCHIFDLVADVGDCDGEVFGLHLNFEYTNTSDSFIVLGNGNNYGTFSYNDLPIFLGPFEGNGQTLEFVVFDQNQESCHDEVVIEAPHCGSGDCAITELVAHPLECNDDGTYSLAINFQYENPGNDFFDVYDGNGELIGYFNLNDLPIVIDHFNPSGNPFDVVTVCINDNPNCCASTEFEALDCEEACQIEGLEAEAFCDGDDLYVEFTFEYSGVGDSFNLLSCTGLGTFAYGQDSYLIQIPDDLVDCAGGIIIPLGVFDQEDQFCGDAVLVEIPDCYDTGCIIGDIEAEISDCENGQFFITLDFDFQDVSDEGFQVFGNGNNYGAFEYAALPITLGPFEANGQYMEFIIMDLVDEECWNFTELEAPVCFAEAQTCIEFESLYNGVNYGGSNSNPSDLLLIEDGVYVTMEGVVDPLGNNNYDYLFATNQDVCSPFEAASGIRMFMFNGLRFDFSELPQNPGVVIFNYHNCGIPFAVSANDQNPVTYVFPETDQSFNLTPGVEIHFDVDEDNPERGTATLEGDIASLFVGGVELQIDNVCFNVDPELTDVWPGDANYDNTATHFDLLNVGLAFGFEGPERDDINIDWFAMPAEDWDGEFLNEANYKHADTNGDGVVNADDKVAILENYGLEHGEVPIFIPVEGTENDPALFVDLPDAEDIIIGQPFEAPIVLGTPAIPVENIYGLAFTLEFDVEMMDENEVAVVLNDSWMGENGQNLITLNKSMAQEGRFEIAITRTDQGNVSGQGTIGHFIGIIDDILGKQETEVTISGVKSINNAEGPVPLNTPTEVVDLTTSIDVSLIEKDLEVFPNPTDETLYIFNKGTEPMRKIRLYNTLGQLMTEIRNPEALQQIDVSRWAAGMYYVTIEIGDAVITKKVKVTNL